MFRQLLHSKQDLYHHLQGNPRNIKRIFNIISMTGSLFEAFQERVGYAICIQIVIYTTFSFRTTYFLELNWIKNKVCTSAIKGLQHSCKLAN